MVEEKSLQDVMSSDLFTSGSRSEIVDVLRFMESHTIGLTGYQVAAISYLEHLDKKNGNSTYKSFINSVLDKSKRMASPGSFIDVISSLTLADRIKGNVRLNNVLGSGNTHK